MTAARTKIRRVLSDYNADRKDLFSGKCGKAYLKEVPLRAADRFVIGQLWSEYEDHQGRLLALTKKIKAFIANGIPDTHRPLGRWVSAMPPAVLWRKSSGGTASEWGSRFVERVLSVTATCRQQGRNVLEFLTDCFRARSDGRPAPSLLG